MRLGVGAVPGTAGLLVATAIVELLVADDSFGPLSLGGEKDDDEAVVVVAADDDADDDDDDDDDDDADEADDDAAAARSSKQGAVFRREHRPGEIMMARCYY